MAKFFSVSLRTLHCAAVPVSCITVSSKKKFSVEEQADKATDVGMIKLARASY